MITSLLAAVAFTSGSLVSLLIGLLVLAIVIYVVFLILGMLPIPAPIKQIVALILGLIFALVCLSFTGCETLTEWQALPQVQLAESIGLKLVASYFNNGGNINSAWGIANGLQIIGDVSAFHTDNSVAAAKVKQAARDFAGNQTAVNGLANDLAGAVVNLAPATASQRAAIVQALAVGIQKGTAALATSEAQP